MAKAGLKGAVWCAVAALWVAVAATACTSAPESADAAANAEAPAHTTQVSGSLAHWKEAVCSDDAGADSGTRHTVNGSACVPQDGDGIVNFDHFESASSMGSVLSWTPDAHVAHTVVDGRPLAIWTPSGEVEDLDPLEQFGFDVVSYQSAGFERGMEPPETVPGAGDTVTLPPNQYNYVVVQTAGGDTQCIVETAFVGCETSGTSWQQHADGSGPYHGVRINTDGTGSWVDGNLGAAAPTTLDDQTYRAQGWTIVSNQSGGLLFTNEKTGHGALVSAAGVQPF